MKIDLKTYWREYLILGLVLVVIILGITSSYYYRRSVAPAETARTKAILANPKTDVVKKFRDNTGAVHTEIKADQNKVSSATLKDTAAHIKGLIDTVKQSLGIADNQQIRELTQEVIDLKVQIKLHQQKDSLGKAILAFNDHWLHLDYNPLDSLLNFHYDASITSTRFYRYPIPFLHFIKSPDYIDFYGDDPRMTINGIKHYTVSDVPPLFGLTADIQAGYGLNSGRFVPSAGIGVRIGRFIMEGREFYSFRSNSFQPMVSAGYRFINY